MRSIIMVLMFVPLPVLAGCNAASMNDGGQSASDGGQAGQDGGMTDTGSSGGRSDGGVATDDGGSCPVQPPIASPPGPAVTSPDATGSGPCAAVKLGAVIDAVHSAHPELNDITVLWDPAQSPRFGVYSYVYAYALPDGGFAMAFNRGSGDCPSGCTEDEYWYFSTGASCASEQVGHYHPTSGYRADGGAGCIQVDGEPMWATPFPPDPTDVCGADTGAQDISGTYKACATGTFFRCARQKSEEKDESVPRDLTIVITQDTQDLSKGTVTVTGVGYSLVDGVVLDAAFSLRRFNASKSYSNLPAYCPVGWEIGISYDFDGWNVPGTLSWHEDGAIDCPDASNAQVCKGEGNATMYLH